MPPVTFRNLTERRLPQFIAVYIGAAWGLVQFVDFITRYGLSPRWTDLTVLAVVLLLPSVILYTYHHGRPGPDKWRRSEKIFIPLNLLLVGSVLVGAGSNLEAVTTRVKVTDEKGNTIEAVVPNKSYRKRIAMFNFDAVNAKTPRWLETGVPELTNEDLRQQQFIQTVSWPRFAERLKQAGFVDGTRIPLSLKRDIANERHIPHFIAGTVDSTAQGFVAKVQLYETASGKLIKEENFTAPSAVELADLISERLLKVLDIPVLADAKPDLPVAELTSSNPEAVRAYIEAEHVAVAKSDWPAAKKLLDRATKLDPSFANAHIVRYLASTLMGVPADAQASVQAALDNSYRLPERTKHYVRAMHYAAKQDFQHAYAVYDMLAQLYPDDIEVHEQLVALNRERDNKDAMIVSMKKVLELDPTRGEMIQGLGTIYEAKGDVTQALKQYEDYARRYPTQPRSSRRIGTLYRKTGEHAKARAQLDKAMLVKAQDVETLLEVAILERNLGNFDVAEQRLQDALAASKTPPERTSVLYGQASLYAARGEIKRLIATREQALSEAAKYQPAQQMLLSQMLMPSLYARTDRAKAEALIKSLKQKLTPPYNLFIPIAEILTYAELEDGAKLESAVIQLEDVVKKTAIKTLAPYSVYGRAKLNEIKGNNEEALRWYQQVIEKDPYDLGGKVDIARMYHRMQKNAEAIRILNEVIRVAPSHGHANLELARIYKVTGDPARSQQHAARARATWKNADPSYDLLKELNSI